MQITAVVVAIWAVANPRKLLIREDLAVAPFFSTTAAVSASVRDSKA